MSNNESEAPSDQLNLHPELPESVESREALYELVFNNLSSGVALLRYVASADELPDDLEVVLINEKLGDYSGIPVSHLRNRRLRPLYTHPVQKRLLDALLNCVKTGKRAEFEEMSPRTGQWYHIGANPIGNQIILTFNDVTALKEAEIRQNKLTQTLQDIFDGSLVGISLMTALRDASGQIVDFLHVMSNQVNADTVGLTKEDIIGHTVAELFPDNFTNGLFDRMVKTVETGEAQRFEMHYQSERLDRWLDLLLTRQEDGILFTYLDTTEKKQAELSRQEQTDLLSKIVSNTPAGKALFEAIRDPEGQIVDFRYLMTNQANARTIGRAIADIEGRTLLELFPGTKPTGFFDKLVTTVETGESQRFQMHYGEDEMDIWLDAYTVKQGDGLLYTFLDISDIKRLQEQQQRQAELFETVLDSALHSIIVCEAVRDDQQAIVDFRITLLNRNAVEATPDQFKLPKEQLLGNTILTLYPDSRQRGIFNRMLEVVNTSVSQRFMHDYPDFGMSFDYSLRKFGDGIIMSMVDITTIRNYQLELEQRNYALKRSNDHLQQFAYVASHDLQEPLRKIQAFGDILVNSYADRLDHQGIDMLQRMQIASRRMSDLIQDLLTYSRVSTRQDSFRPLDLKSLIEGVLGDLEMIIRERQAQIRIDDLPTVNGDAMQLRQLFQNLLTNALKFTKPGTGPVVHISSRTVSGGELADTTPLSARQVYYEINVQDNGIGFDEKYIERIFQVFQRLHGRQQYSGTGIGLAICKKVVENHEGLLKARSIPGQGSSFLVYLPVRLADS